MKSKLFYFVFSVFLISCTDDPPIPDDDARLSRQLSRLFEAKEADGFYGSVYIQKEGAVLLERGFGIQNQNPDILNKPYTIFDIGSLTKQFTASAILKLEMDGFLHVENTLMDYFPEVPDDKKDITIHQLLTHTAGFREGIGDDYDIIGADDFIDLAFASPLINNPGTIYAYSNVGYSILGIIIEKVSHTTYENYLRAQLWIPAGMKETGYILPDFKNDRMAIGFMVNKPVGFPNAPGLWADDGPGWHLRANGGILSSVSDMQKWDKALNGETVLNFEAKEKLFFPYVAEDPEESSFYGYGWTVSEAPTKNPVYWHDGGNDVFYAIMFRIPEDKLTMVLMSNRASSFDETVIEEVMELIYNSL
ncbi:class A beta-lactamase-related serine hydrolase [Sinomicrobium pectinilyticum]|uniref:Class A beta-lactamase-related serine hydrolase n=1 Tax=Sinomicrobium pectinilyticum TaxID=1084421 RepID=A0A3N0EKL3_SINP1|nr:serine hydrolase domain-containing protein [Sinomicrobium pectinilyticum]RNL88453.1 class A beta-lactamase-related serine hydrolase [Sinomicrobium pectinilyticum]